MKSENSEKLFTGHVFSVRRARPANTPPGPSSQNSVAPAAAALLMQSSQRTDDTTCFTKAALIASGSDNAWPVVLENTVNLGAKNGTDYRKPPNAARAGSIKRE